MDSMRIGAGFGLVACAAWWLLAGAPTVHAQSGSPAVPPGYESQSAPTTPAPAPADPRVRVRFHSTDGIAPTVFARSGSGWRRLCTAPCEQRLGFGAYAFALSLGDDAPVAVRGRAIDVGLGALELDLHYDDASHDHDVGTGLIVGGLLVAGAVGGGLLGATFALLGMGSPAGVLTFIFSIVGFAGGLAMLIAGIVLAARGPSARMSEAPAAAIWPGH